MYPVQQVTNDPEQKQVIVLPDSSQITLEIRFVPMQYGWFVRRVSYQGFETNCIRITNLPNILYQFKNQVPFGLACFSTTDREPSLSDDFSSGASSLFILSAEEVQQYTDFLTSG